MLCSTVKECHAVAVLNRMWPIFLFGGDRELVFLARSRVTGRHDSEPSCAGVVGVVGGWMHFLSRFLSVSFVFFSPSLIFILFHQL